MVYLKNDNATGLMGFYGAFGSTADQYFEGGYTTNYTHMTAYNLPNTVNTGYLDSGYSLQWNKSTLASDEEWIVTAYERWTGEGDVQIIPGSDMSGTVGSSVTTRFTVVNFQTNSDTFNLAPSVNQAGWTADLPGGTNLALGIGASSNVVVQVTIGSATQCLVTLVAQSQTDLAVTNSDSLTVTGSEDGWVAIQVTPSSGSWALTAPSGYVGPTSGTGNLAAVSAVTGTYGIAYGALTGYASPNNQSQFVTGGSTTLFTGCICKSPRTSRHRKAFRPRKAVTQTGSE